MSRIKEFPDSNAVLFYSPKCLTGWEGHLFYWGLALMRGKFPQFVHTALYVDGHVINLIDDGLYRVAGSFYDSDIITVVPFFVAPCEEKVNEMIENATGISWWDFLRAVLGLPLRGLVCTSFVSFFVEHSMSKSYVITPDELYANLRERTGTRQRTVS